MANGDKRDCTLTVRLKEDHFEHIKPGLDALKESKRRYPAVVMACMIEGEYNFQRNPSDISRFRDMWKPTEDDTIRKDFRCPRTFEAWAKKVSNSLNSDVNSFIISSIHRNLSFFVENPEMVDSVYRNWMENQLAKSTSALRQTSMSERMSEQKTRSAA